MELYNYVLTSTAVEFREWMSNHIPMKITGRDYLSMGMET